MYSVLVLTLPNILTILRITLVPLVVIFMYVEHHKVAWVSASLFALAGVTDYFDGYLARRFQSTSHFGRFLDPVADKLLVASVLLMLAGLGTLQGLALIPAVIILCREILVSGLREFLAEIAVPLPVTRLAKWKTALQIGALGFLIWGDPFPQYLPVPYIGLWGLWGAALLTLVTGYDYLMCGLYHMKAPSSTQHQQDESLI
ncbi:MAG: CDP-diacylglycerol--glycerol-3-phosphate 3-phosphatidyltransferase [Alphaproteobacteria bacterium]|jgi:cardiolipin synthase|nr:CDP-diacylglycerol--glycerol-3-phosphate 3-phosphatidyltransferase [Alphaproteobacteria bacterium]